MEGSRQLEILNQIHQQEVLRYQSDHIPLLLRLIKENQLDRQQLIEVISRRYQVAHFFEDMLRYMISVIEIEPKLSDEARNRLLFSVAQNLKEELGEVIEYGGPHKQGREVFLTALGINYESWIRSLGSYESLDDLFPSSKHLINSIKKVVSKGAIEAVSALWYYENRISLDGVLGDYYILLKAFEQQFPEFKKGKYKEGDALWHIASHAEHDEYHAKLAEDGLAAVIDQENTEQKIASTCNEMRKVFDKFWDEVYEEVVEVI